MTVSEQEVRPSRPWLKRLIVYGTLVVIIAAFAPWWTRRLLYPASFRPAFASAPDSIQEIRLPLSSGGQSLAWFLPHTNPDAPVLVFFHGNGQVLQDLWDNAFLQRFQSQGVHVLAVEYPGFGYMKGSPSETTLLEAAEANMDWVLTEYPASRKIICGWSLGSGVAIQTAAAFQGHFDALILFSPWSSLKDVARHHYPDWFVNLFLKEVYDSTAAAEQIAVPSLVIHGGKDKIIPASQGEKIAATLGKNAPCQWIFMEEGDHYTVLNASLSWDAVGSILLALKSPVGHGE